MAKKIALLCERLKNPGFKLVEFDQFKTNDARIKRLEPGDK